MTVRFVKGATDFTTKNPLFPYRPTHDRYQFKGKTAGATKVIQELATATDAYTFQFRDMSTTDRDNLFGLFKDDIDGAMATFTFTDVDSVAHTARWMNEWDFAELMRIDDESVLMWEVEVLGDNIAYDYDAQVVEDAYDVVKSIKL